MCADLAEKHPHVSFGALYSDNRLPPSFTFSLYTTCITGVCVVHLKWTFKSPSREVDEITCCIFVTLGVIRSLHLVGWEDISRGNPASLQRIW